MAHAAGVTPSTVIVEQLVRGHEFSFVQVMLWVQSDEVFLQG
jgi:hypothetical protein